MMIGRLGVRDGSAGWEVSLLTLSCAFSSCAFRPVATDAAIAEPRNPRRLVGMNSPCLQTARRITRERTDFARWLPVESRGSRPAEPFDFTQGSLARRRLLHHLKQTRDTFVKIGSLGDQAQHKMAFVGKIIEVAGMDDNTHLPHEINGQIFVSPKRGNPQDDIPSALDLQSRAGGTACELAIEFREILAQTIEKNGLDLFALIEQHRG